MKKHLLFLAFILLPLIGQAQQENKPLPTDTTIIIKGRKYIIREADKKLNIKVYGKTQRGDTIADDMIYEATYNDEQTTERRFEFSFPFQKPRHRYSFDAHNQGIYIGYGDLYQNFGIAGSSAFELRESRTWEIGINLFSGHWHISNDGHWGATTSLGWGYRSFRLDDNYAFNDINGKLVVSEGSDNNVYSESRLRYNFLRLPICVEWQTYVRGRVFFSAGVEPEWRYRIKSKAKVNGANQTLGSDLYVHPIGLNALLQGGVNNIGFYARCSMTQLFEKDKGPKAYPFSFGIMWYW
jgi:hypothetical protein